MKYKTVAYKGSKRKLLTDIEAIANDIGARTIFDGFSGTGIVSAHLRHKGFQVDANDISESAYIFGSVFLQGYNEDKVKSLVSEMNNLKPVQGWLTENYSGTQKRVIRGTGGEIQERPLGYTPQNAMKIDAAREYIEGLSIQEEDKRALIFSVILGADSVFNNSNDQKSSLKNWQTKSLKEVAFQAPTLVTGFDGIQYRGNILEANVGSYDMVYLDPPYTHGVLYDSCYHLNDSIATWEKPDLDYDYALPRPKNICYRKNGEKAGMFYNKSTAVDCFTEMSQKFDCKRLVLSYSDAPRNTLTIEELFDIFSKRGKCYIRTKDHKICTQPKAMNKISTNLKEYFIIIDS
jgi:adenine-specific DNA methylase